MSQDILVRRKAARPGVAWPEHFPDELTMLVQTIPFWRPGLFGGLGIAFSVCLVTGLVVLC